MGCSQLPNYYSSNKLSSITERKIKNTYKIPLPQRLRNAILLGQHGIPLYLESREKYRYLMATSLG